MAQIRASIEQPYLNLRKLMDTSMVGLKSVNLPAKPSTLLGSPAEALTLRVHGSQYDGQIIQLSSAKCTVGAAPTCTFRLVHPAIGPMQCIILRGKHGTIVRNRSANTRINGRTFDDAKLHVGDRLSIGPIDFDVLSSATQEKVHPSQPTPSTTKSFDEQKLRTQCAHQRSRSHKLLDSLRTSRKEEVRYQSEKEQQAQWTDSLEQKLNDLESRLAEYQSQEFENDVQQTTLSRQIDQWKEAAQQLEDRFNQQQETYQLQLDQHQVEREAQDKGSRKSSQKLQEIREKLDKAEANLSNQQQNGSDELVQSMMQLKEEKLQLKERKASWSKKQQEAEKSLAEQKQHLDESQQDVKQEQESFRQKKKQWRDQKTSQEEQFQELNDQIQHQQEKTEEDRNLILQEKNSLEEGKQQFIILQEQFQQEQQILQQEKQSHQQECSQWEQSSRELEIQREQLEAERAEFEEFRQQSQQPQTNVQAELQSDVQQSTSPNQGDREELFDLEVQVDSTKIEHAQESSNEKPASNEQEVAFKPISESAPISTADIFKKLGHTENLPEEKQEEEQGQERSSEASSAASQSGSVDANFQPDIESSAAEAEAEISDSTQENKLEEESIEQYMTRLLQRVRGEDQLRFPEQLTTSLDSSPSKPSAEASSSNESHSSLTEDPQSESQPETTPLKTVEEFRPRSKAPEETANLLAMRQLANDSARSAIETSIRRRWIKAVNGKIAVSISATALGGALLWTSKSVLSYVFVGSIASFAVAAVWGVQSLLLTRKLLSEKESSGDGGKKSHDHAEN